jgi:hypothetical protein
MSGGSFNETMGKVYDGQMLVKTDSGSLRIVDNKPHVEMMDMKNVQYEVCDGSLKLHTAGA